MCVCVCVEPVHQQRIRLLFLEGPSTVYLQTSTQGIHSPAACHSL